MREYVRALDLRLNLMGMGAFIASYIARYGRIEMMPDREVVEVVRARDRVARSCGARSAAGCQTLPPSTTSRTSSGSGWRWWLICVGLWEFIVVGVMLVVWVGVWLCVDISLWGFILSCWEFVCLCLCLCCNVMCMFMLKAGAFSSPTTITCLLLLLFGWQLIATK